MQGYTNHKKLNSLFSVQLSLLIPQVTIETKLLQVHL